jgi:cytoskeletal protein RodZ
VTLLAPFKHITALKLSKLSALMGEVSPLEHWRSRRPIPAPLEIATPTPGEILQQLGGKLQQLRQERQLSIQDLSVSTRIQARLIQAIEEGHIEMLPEPVYVKAMVKRYANSLGADGLAMSHQVPTWEPDMASFDPITKLQATGFSAPIPKLKPIQTKGLHTGFNFDVASTLNHLRPKPSAPNEPDFLTPTSGEQLAEIGSKLRQLREERQLSIEDLSLRTSIQPKSIRAIELGQIELLPEPIYVKSMVKRYADSVGLDGLVISQQVPNWDPEVATFDPVTKIQVTGFYAPVQLKPNQTTGLNAPVKIKPIYVYMGYTLAIVTICAGASNLLNDATKPLPATIEVIKPNQPIKTTVVPVSSAQMLSSAGVQVGVVVKRPTWAQIGIDGTTKFTGNLQAGMQLSWIATKQITINTNNAGGLLISHGKQPLKVLGKVDQKQSVTIKVGK